MSFPDTLRSTEPLIRQKTAADWAAGNYLLLTGELGIESDTGRRKVGEGKLWNSTDYALIGTGINNIVSLTQAEYDALTPDANTLYVIT